MKAKIGGRQGFFLLADQHFGFGPDRTTDAKRQRRTNEQVHDADENQETPIDEKAGTIRQVFRKGEQFIEELLAENERLKMRVVQLEDELQSARQSVPPDTSAEKLQRILESLKKEHETLRRRYEAILQDSARYKERYQSIEEENEKMANLFVASYQLHSTMDFPTATQVVIEILLNFVGAGRFGIFLADGSSPSFSPLAAHGAEPRDLPVLTTDNALVADAVSTGQPAVRDTSLGAPTESEPVVCVPLRLGQEIRGLVAIFSFLQQKTEIVQLDLDLFGLLTDNAAGVLESTFVLGKKPDQFQPIDAYRRMLEENHA